MLETGAIPRFTAIESDALIFIADELGIEGKFESLYEDTDGARYRWTATSLVKAEQYMLPMIIKCIRSYGVEVRLS